MSLAPAQADNAQRPLYDTIAFLGGVSIDLGMTAGTGSAATDAALPFGGIAAVEHLIAQAENAPEPALDPIATGTVTDGVFGSVAIPMHNFPAARRWAGMMAAIERCAGQANCGGRNQLLSLIDEQTKDKPFLDRMRIVNSMVNGLVRYRTDRAAYGVVDHWATPTETLARGAGDCEDFAILKMTALMREGVPAKSLSVVVLHDSRHMAYHAVLAVATSEGRYILDNTIADVVRDETLPSYQPLYSLSTDRAWVHGTRSPSRYATASAQNLVTIAPGDGVMDIE